MRSSLAPRARLEAWKAGPRTPPAGEPLSAAALSKRLLLETKERCVWKRIGRRDCFDHMQPLEVAPHLRLQYTDQPNGPYLTVASQKLRSDETFPNGLYLRSLDDGLWLRGYCATPDVVFAPDFSDFAFLLSIVPSVAG